MGSSVGKLTNQNQKVTRYGYLSDELVMRIKNADLSMEKLWNGEFDDLYRTIGSNGIEELKKFLIHVPKLDLEVQVMPITRAILKV